MWFQERVPWIDHPNIFVSHQVSCPVQRHVRDDGLLGGLEPVSDGGGLSPVKHLLKGRGGEGVLLDLKQLQRDRLREPSSREKEEETFR